MRISNTKVQFQINTGPRIHAGGVYLKFGRVDPAFNRANAVFVVCCGIRKHPKGLIEN